MSQRVVPAKMNIYTVLAVIATLVLLAGIGVVWSRSSKLTGEGSPWYVEPATTNQQSTVPAAN